MPPGPPAAPAGYAPAYPAAPGYGYYAPPYEYERTKQIDRTKTGVLLLLIGTLLSWIPFGVAIIGYILIFVGAILVILGRKAFGATHSRNVVISIVLFILGVIVAFAVAVIVALSNLPSIVTPGGGMSQPAVLQAAMSAGLAGGIAVALVIGIAEILFIYGLQVQTGRLLLWAAYGANLALSIAIYVVISPLVPGIQTSVNYDAVSGQQATLELLRVIPVALFVAADYLAWSRINRGEIPEHPGGPTGPTAMAPPASFPPAAPPQAPPPSGPAPPMSPP